MSRPLLILVLLVLFAGCSTRPDPGAPVDEGLVSPERLAASLDTLTGIHSRFMHWDPGAAETVSWLLATLTEQGCFAEADSFTYVRKRPIHTANVAATFPGLTRPDEFVLVGAHWDCIAYPESDADSSVRAEGAVDNATGVAALVELARLLVDRPLERSVKVIFFANEELGMTGSRRERDHWNANTDGDSLVCMINVDMLGYDPDAIDASLICNTLTAPLAAEVLPAMRAATDSMAVDSLLETNYGQSGGSDHLQFWYYGLPAMWLHEGPDDPFPHANSDLDTRDAVQLDVLADGTRALVAAVVQLAVPLPEP